MSQFTTGIVEGRYDARTEAGHLTTEAEKRGEAAKNGITAG